MDSTLFRKPSAILPLLMSFLALSLVIAHLALTGATSAADEDSAAQVFQLLIAGQAPVVAFFAIRWLPREPAQTLMMMSLQAAAALVALAPVVIFDL